MGKKSLSTSESVNDPEDFERMYEVNLPLIYRFIFWRTQDEMLAQDLTGSVFEKAWRTRRNFTGGSAKSWLFRIAHTTLIDYWRIRKDITDDDTVAELVDNRAEIGDVVDQQMRADQLQQAVAQLPNEMRRVIELRFIEGCSTRETAKQLGVSESNARVLQYRALKKLRGFLQ